MVEAFRDNPGYRRVVYMVAIIGALGGLLFGLDQGFIANSLGTITKVYHLTVSEGEEYSAMISWGAVIGTLLSGFMLRGWGRKKVLILAGFLFVAMTVISALLPPLVILVICRGLIGFAVGVASFAVPLYLSETATTNIRGTMVTMFQLMITIGIFVITLTNVIIIKSLGLGHSNVALTVMFLVIVVFAATMFFCSWYLPESPRWLLLKGREEEAVIVLNKIRRTKQEAQADLSEIKTGLVANRDIGWDRLGKGYFWKVLILGVALQMFQQLVGINLMIYYAPTIFGYAGMTGVIALLIVPFFNTLSTFPALKWIEKWGRKKLLYFGSVIMFIAMFVAGFAFLSIAHSKPTAVTDVILLLAAIVYIFGFACSWGPVAWVVCSEIFPLKGREIGMTVTTMVNWTFVGIVTSSALSFMRAYGNASIFFVFGIFCLLSMVFLKLFVPETKGISLEKLEKNLESGVSLRKIGS